MMGLIGFSTVRWRMLDSGTLVVLAVCSLSCYNQLIALHLAQKKAIRWFHYAAQVCVVYSKCGMVWPALLRGRAEAVAVARSMIRTPRQSASGWAGLFPSRWRMDSIFCRGSGRPVTLRRPLQGSHKLLAPAGSVLGRSFPRVWLRFGGSVV